MEKQTLIVTAGHETVSQAGIILKRAGEQIAQKGDDLIVVAAGIALLDRRAVFVDNDYSLDAVVLESTKSEVARRIATSI